MVYITIMNISAVDLNLFLVFDAVFEERSTTRAASRLHVTQSAVSNALARLRQTVGDPLFVRNGRGLAPTPRADEMRLPVREAIGRLSQALGQRFDPRSTTRTFTVACADHHQAADVPRLAKAFASAMPSACLRIVSVDYLLSSDGLAAGTVDAALAPEGTDGPGLHAARLFEESAVVVVRKRHPTTGTTLSVAQLNALGHIDVHLALGQPGQVNRAVSNSLEELGLHRRTAMIVPSFTTAAMAAATTDYVAWLPDHAARLYTRILPLRAVKTRLPALAIGCVLLWHDRTHVDPGACCFRDLVIDSLRATRLRSAASPRGRPRGSRTPR